jgi:hypothetical protein
MAVVKVNFLRYLECDIVVLVEVVSSHGIGVGQVVNPPRVVVSHMIPLFTGGGIL